MDPNLLFTYLILRICKQNPTFGPCFLSPCICWQKLSFCGNASHAEKVSNEVLVSPGRQKSPDYSRWPDRRFWSFLAPQNRCRHGFCQRPGYEPKNFFRRFRPSFPVGGPSIHTNRFRPDRTNIRRLLALLRSPLRSKTEEPKTPKHPKVALKSVWSKT